MNESKFIELLNLYLDHQISPADAAWLENEIQQNPERRQIYRQYCRMQKACVVLAENFRTAAPALAVPGGKVVAFQPRVRAVRATYALGALAAAACVALVMMNRRDLFAPAAAMQLESPAQVAQIAPPPSTRAPDASGLGAAPAARPALQPAFAGLVRENAAAEGALTSADRANFEWMTRMRIDRVPNEQMWFEAQPTIQAQELMFHTRPASQTQAENAAFRFQR